MEYFEPVWELWEESRDILRKNFHRKITVITDHTGKERPERKCRRKCFHCLKLGGTAELIRPKHIFLDMFRFFCFRKYETTGMKTELKHSNRRNQMQIMQHFNAGIEKRKMEENNED